MKFNEKIGFKTSAGIQASIESYMYYPFHLHDTYIEIICVLNGSVDIYDSAVCYKLKENEIHILNAKDPHKIISDIPHAAGAMQAAAAGRPVAWSELGILAIGAFAVFLGAVLSVSRGPPSS